MPIGDEAKSAIQSYVAYGKESTFGTYASATTAIEALSCSFRTDVESQKLDTFGPSRDFMKRVALNKTVGGGLEAYLHPQESVLLLAGVLGGGIATTSLTSAATHSLTAGNFDTSPASLSFNVRKGGDTGHTWRYTGGRVDSLKISAAINEPVKLAVEMIFKDSTQASDSIAGILSISSVIPYVYTGGNYKYSSTESGAANSTNSERITGFELSISNNFDADAGRELGSNVPRVIPPKRREIEFKVTQRFDTMTVWNRFIQNTQGAVELFFRGESVSSEYFFDMTIRMPKVFVKSPDPEIGGPDEILMSEIEFDVLNDNPSTTTGKAIGVTIINSTTAGY